MEDPMHPWPHHRPLSVRELEDQVVALSHRLEDLEKRNQDLASEVKRLEGNLVEEISRTNKAVNANAKDIGKLIFAGVALYLSMNIWKDWDGSAWWVKILALFLWLLVFFG